MHVEKIMFAMKLSVELVNFKVKIDYIMEKLQGIFTPEAKNITKL